MKGAYVKAFMRATRIERTLIPLSHLMIAVGIMGRINTNIFLLGICCFFIYLTGGILNAKVDGDFKIGSTGVFTFLLILGTFFISLKNPLIFLSVFLWVILSFIYNKYSRHVFFSDSILLSLTHVAIPILFGMLLLGAKINYSFITTAFFFFSFLMLVPIKNINGVKEDIVREYKTLMTSSRHGRPLTYSLFNCYIITISISYFLFGLNELFLIIFAIIIFVKLLMDCFLIARRDDLVYKFARLIIVLFSFGIVVGAGNNVNIVLVSFCLVLHYMIYLLLTLIKEVKK